MALPTYGQPFLGTLLPPIYGSFPVVVVPVGYGTPIIRPVPQGPGSDLDPFPADFPIPLLGTSGMLTRFGQPLGANRTTIGPRYGLPRVRTTAT